MNLLCCVGLSLTVIPVAVLALVWLGQLSQAVIVKTEKLLSAR